MTQLTKSKSTTWEGFLADVRQKTGLGAIARVEYTGVELRDFESLEDCDKDDVLNVFAGDSGPNAAVDKQDPYICHAAIETLPVLLKYELPRSPISNRTRT